MPNIIAYGYTEWSWCEFENIHTHTEQQNHKPGAFKISQSEQGLSLLSNV